MQKVCSDYTPAVFLQERHISAFNSFLLLSFDHLERGFDQTAKKVIVSMLKSLQINLNGISQDMVAFTLNKP
jgi:hypothetical protein